MDRTITTQALYTYELKAPRALFSKVPYFPVPGISLPLQGGAHFCDGLTNFGHNSKPGASALSALDEAACRNIFTYDAEWSPYFGDFYITRVSSSPQTETKGWGLLVNWQQTVVGGCQQEIKPGDHVLWAYDAFNPARSFLQLYPDEDFGAENTKGSIGSPLKLSMRNGLTG